jgi:hypothetical protein
VTTTFQVAGQGGKVLAKKTSTFDFRRKFGGVVALTFFTPILVLLKFRYDEGFFDDFDLLMFFRRFVRRLQFAAALRTSIEFEFDGLIDLVFGERLTKMLFVSLLSADFAFFRRRSCCFGGLTRSEDGGFEELLEFFSSAAIFALSIAISSRSCSRRMACSNASFFQSIADSTLFCRLITDQFQSKAFAENKRASFGGLVFVPIGTRYW